MLQINEPHRQTADATSPDVSDTATDRSVYRLAFFLIGVLLVGAIGDRLVWVLSQLLAYSPIEWLAFITVAFCAARWGGWLGVLAGQFAVAIVICVLDVLWVQSAMQQPDWQGLPDMDFIFAIGVLIRIFLINATLLPISALALWSRRRALRTAQPNDHG